MHGRSIRGCKRSGAERPIANVEDGYQHKGTRSEVEQFPAAIYTFTMYDAAMQAGRGASREQQRRMRFSFTSEQWVPFPLARVFAFFADPLNLPRLMPAWQDARIDRM